MKKLFITGLVAAMFSLPLAAQDKDKKSGDWENKVRTELKLTEEQMTKFDAVNKEYKEKADAMQQNAGVSKDAMKETKMKMKDEKEAKMAEFLTPEQMTKYKEMMDDKKKKMKKKDKAKDAK